MTRTLLTHRVSDVNAKEHIQLTTQQRSGVDAAAYALRIYPWPSAPSTPSLSTPSALETLLELMHHQDMHRSVILNAIESNNY